MDNQTLGSGRDKQVPPNGADRQVPPWGEGFSRANRQKFTYRPDINTDSNLPNDPNPETSPEWWTVSYH